MDALSLDPGDYGGTYKLIGGRSALDLVNTISWAGDPNGHDWLRPAANAIIWAAAVGLISPAEEASLAKAFTDDSTLASCEVDGLIGLREVLDAVLRPLCMHDLPQPTAVASLNERLASCPPPSVDVTDLSWTQRPIERLADTHHQLVRDAADIITSSDHRRLGHCPSCNWLFVDTTRNRSRRWCDMADCGSRDKARRYYHRQRQ